MAPCILGLKRCLWIPARNRNRIITKRSECFSERENKKYRFCMNVYLKKLAKSRHVLYFESLDKSTFRNDRDIFL